MRFVTEKKVNNFATFLIISGLGALWLTFWWYKASIADVSSYSLENQTFAPYLVLFYYIFNSVMLVLSGITLFFKRYGIHSIITITLGISVTISLFIFGKGDFVIWHSLFISTVILGMVYGAMYGGSILVPMFLVGVYSGAIWTIKHMMGKTEYTVPETTMINSPSSLSVGNEDVEISDGKSIIQKIIPIIGILVGLYYGINYWSWFSFLKPQINEAFPLLISISLIILSIFSIRNGNLKIYKIINIIIAILILYPFIVPIIVIPINILNTLL